MIEKTLMDIAQVCRLALVHAEFDPTAADIPPRLEALKDQRMTTAAYRLAAVEKWLDRVRAVLPPAGVNPESNLPADLPDVCRLAG